jgi:hypothetical protein
MQQQHQRLLRDEAREHNRQQLQQILAEVFFGAIRLLNSEKRRMKRGQQSFIINGSTPSRSAGRGQLRVFALEAWPGGEGTARIETSKHTWNLASILACVCLSFLC